MIWVGNIAVVQQSLTYIEASNVRGQSKKRRSYAKHKLHIHHRNRKISTVKCIVAWYQLLFTGVCSKDPLPDVRRLHIVSISRFGFFIFAAVPWGTPPPPSSWWWYFQRWYQLLMSKGFYIAGSGHLRSLRWWWNFQRSSMATFIACVVPSCSDVFWIIRSCIIVLMSDNVRRIYPVLMSNC